ncbi:MAG: Lrp/AsnC family transcriptional regulator [Pseudomonadota bacterium]
MLDAADRRLLRYLQDDPEQPVSAVADAARVPQATATRRLEKLRAEGVIRGTRAQIDWRALGYEVEVSLRITLDKADPRAFDSFLHAAREVPEVIELQTFLGRVDIRLSVIARDMAHYQTLYRSSILTLPHIADIEALMQVAQVAKRRNLPI